MFGKREIDSEKAYCKYCKTHVLIKYGGKNDIEQHLKTARHKECAEKQDNVVPQLLYFFEFRSATLRKMMLDYIRMVDQRSAKTMKIKNFNSI